MEGNAMSEEQEKYTGKDFGWLLLAILVSAPAYALDGWVIVKMWQWFITEHYGIAAPPIVVAIGLMILIAFLTHQRDWNDRGKQYGTRVVVSYFKPLYFLIVAYIIHLFM